MEFENRYSKREANKFNPKKPMNAKDLERYAISCGCFVECRGGNHGKHIVAPDGLRRPLPDHGGRDLATGTLKGILRFINQHGLPQSPVRMGMAS